MIVFLWDSCGPGRFHGVSDDQARALQAAEACITSGAASGARVEVAQLVTGFAALTSHYRRTGHGWTAQGRRRDGVVTWVPSHGRDTRMKPMPEDEIAALFRSAYGGDANVELSENGMNVWVQPASGGSVYARLEDADSPVLAALLGVYRCGQG